MKKNLYSCFSSLLLLLSPSFVHAEAFKGGLLSPGTENALFFIFLLIILGVGYAVLNLLFNTLQFVQNKDKDHPNSSYGCYASVFTAIIILLILIANIK